MSNDQGNKQQRTGPDHCDNRRFRLQSHRNLPLQSASFPAERISDEQFHLILPIERSPILERLEQRPLLTPASAELWR